MRSSFLIAALAIAAAVILGFTFYLRQSAEEPTVSEPLPPMEQEPMEAPVTSPVADTPQTAVEEVMTQTPPSPAIDEPVLVLPPLNESDGFVRERIPEAVPAPWRERDDLLRRAAVVLENATRGEIPKRQLSFLAPDGSYPRAEGGGAGRRPAALFCGSCRLQPATTAIWTCWKPCRRRTWPSCSGIRRRCSVKRWRSSALR